jgi:two-component system KDP operon response regulator KdpE
VKVLAITNSPKMMEDVSFCVRLRWQNAIFVCATEGSKGVEMVEAETPEVVVADTSLKDMDGVDVVRQIRQFSDTPLIMVGGQQSEGNAARFLEEGADEYISSPFNLIEFLARMNAVLRRTYRDGYKRNLEPFLSGNLEINFSTRQVFVSGKPVKLTLSEYNLLRQLIRSEGMVVTHRTLLEKVWGMEYANDSGILRRHICCLRQKIGDDTLQPHIILSERGVGYKFVKSA